MRFQAPILPAGKTATGVQVPDKVIAGLGAGKRPPVRVTINGYTYRSTVAVMGGVFMLGISAEVRERAGVAAGNVIDVYVELDTDPRDVTMPPDFTEALDADEEARRFFDGMSYGNRRRLVLAIEDAKSAETRQRRIDKTVSALREGRA
jgi:hypothetical protein